MDFQRISPCRFSLPCHVTHVSGRRVCFNFPSYAGLRVI